MVDGSFYGPQSKLESRARRGANPKRDLATGRFLEGIAVALAKKSLVQRLGRINKELPATGGTSGRWLTVLCGDQI
jgi:hypothetical protein